jgi:hypothetical protein
MWRKRGRQKYPKITSSPRSMKRVDQENTWSVKRKFQKRKGDGMSKANPFDGREKRKPIHISVAIYPGQIPLTCTLCWLHSLLSAFVS